MPITIHQVAEAAGVSIATVSRVLSNSGHTVNAETRKRVLAAALKLGYRANQSARGLRTDRSSLIAIIADDIVSPFTPIIIRGIEDYLKPSGYFCLIINANADPIQERAAIRDLSNHALAGYIFVESWSRSDADELDLADRQAVFVHRLFSDAYRLSVIPDERYGANLAMAHLLGLGHRRIGHIGGPTEYYASADRFFAYREALERAGINFDSSLVAQGDWEVRAGYAGTQKFLAQPQPPSAIFAANDLMAAGAIHACQSAGLRVPDDVAVVGYDDRDLMGLVHPALTTITLPCYDMGQASAKLLLDVLENKAENSEEIKIRGQLLIRASSGEQAIPTGAEKPARRKIRRQMETSHGSTLKYGSGQQLTMAADEQSEID